MREYDFARLLAMHDDPHFQAQAEQWLRGQGMTSLPPSFNTPGEVVLDYLGRTNPDAIGRMLQEHERVHGPLPGRPALPVQQQQQAPARPAAPQPQQQPQSKIDPQTKERLLKLLAVDKVAAQAKKMAGSSAVRQFLTPQFEQSAAATLKKLGATIPQGHTAGETMLAGLALFKNLPHRDVALLAQETRGAFGDAAELRRAISKLATHDMADEVTKLERKQQDDMDRARYGPNGKPKVEPAPDKWSTRDAVAQAYAEVKAKSGPPTPRKVYTRQQLQEQRTLNKLNPGEARPIERTRELTHELAQEARDQADAALIDHDPSDDGAPSPAAEGASDG